jgi:hypothetical protein
MKKKLFALSGVFLIVLVIAGLWATRAINITDVQNTVDPGATSLPGALSIREMAESAPFIVMGTCLETKSQWVGRSLVTLATVSVSESLKGDTTEKLTVVLPGGYDIKGKFPIAMTYAGAPQMSPGEEVFLFLTTQDEVAGGYAVMGFAQGKYSVSQDTKGEKVVMRDMTKAPVQGGAGAIRGNPQVVPLSEFKALVKSYLK